MSPPASKYNYSHTKYQEKEILKRYLRGALQHKAVTKDETRSTNISCPEAQT